MDHDHSLRYDVNCSIIFTELPLLSRPAAVRAAGFDAVEFWWPFDHAVPTGAEADAFVHAVEDAGVALVGLNFFAGDMPAGDRGVVSWPGREQEFRDNVTATVEIGARLGCRRFNALYGNRVDGVDPARQDELAVANLALAAAEAARAGGVVLLEAVSGAPRYPLLTADRVADVMWRVEMQTGVPNLALLADLYHLAVNGDDVDAVIAGYASRIGHVQIADSPGRAQPGTGTLPLDQQLAALHVAGYAGFVGLEYRPAGASADSFDWLPPHRRQAALP